MAVVTDAESTRLASVGPLDPIAGAVKTYREGMERENSFGKVEPLARQLYDLVWKPLAPQLGNARTVYFVPDGVLHLLPFKALLDDQGRYLGQSTHLVQLASGRDLVLPSFTGKTSAPVIFAGPEYSLASSQGGVTVTRAMRKLDGSRRSDIMFDPLPGTLDEGKMLQELMSQTQFKPQLVTRAEATEQRLMTVQAPRVLHMATHGFFLDTQIEAAQAPPMAAFKIGSGDGAAALSALTPKQPERDALVSLDPMTQAGLAMAGANDGVRGHLQADGSDGVLTALEAVALELAGTDLVVLSACQTGIGSVRNGDGVHGLQRAFQEAGAKAVLSTLWSISDEGTAQFMRSFYNRILSGPGRSYTRGPEEELSSFRS